MLKRNSRLPLLLVVILSPWILMNSPALAQSQLSSGKFGIVIHGGAGGEPDKWTDEYKQKRREGLSAALKLGVALLKEKKPALDVVEQVVRILEDDPIFNAGRGCVLNEKGEHELDASIMDGSNRACGSVAGVRTIKNPISLARRVMTDTKHVLLTGSGADEFGQSVGLEKADAAYFRTPEQLQAWEKWRNKITDARLHRPKSQDDIDPLYLGTVGCVVLDVHGNLAAGTSTGGLMGKRWGRVGDSPIIGAGTFADNKTCAVSGTGVGEDFIRNNVAADIAARMRYAGKSLAESAKAVVQTVLPEDCGGIIAIDHDGNITMEFNTPGMSRGAANSSGRFDVLLGKETR
jgi:L-asparaginase / beta-aspartyl-peptidase